jgi:D-glycero-alpha-D-manno-heptose 1-phosphate guanylyltransferase
MKNISVAILAGGLGTRLRPALGGVPKVLAKIGDRFFITILLEWLEVAGIERVVLLTGHQAEKIQHALGNRFGSMTIDYSIESIQLGTAGAIRQALPLLQTDTVLLLNGDSYCDVNLSLLTAEHSRRQAEMTLTLTRVSDVGRFGLVETDIDGRLIRFVEKQEHTTAGWINAGVYVLERSLIEAIPRGRTVSLERDLLPTWERTRRLFGYRSGGRFLDIGTPSSYAEAAGFSFSPASQTRVWPARVCDAGLNGHS